MRAATAAVAVAGLLALPVAAAPAGAAGGTTLTVTTAADTSTGGCDAASCTLREAIEEANALPDGEAATITFAVPGPLPVTIRPNGALPWVGGTTTVDGTSQPGYQGTPVVELDLRTSGALGVATNTTVTIRGLAVNRSQDDGIVAGAGRVLLDRNFIGTDVTGTVDRGNAGNGVFMRFGYAFIVVRDNLVSGNGSAGIAVDDMLGSVEVLGNRIGTDVTGTAALPNLGGGIVFDGTPGTIAGNLVSGNRGHGMTLSDHFGDTPYVAGNLVGTDAAGSARLPNDGDGLHLGPGYFRVGSPEQPNVVAGNRGDGIAFVGDSSGRVEGNRIGTDLSGRARLGNGGAGISVQDDGSWLNDGTIGGELPATANRVAFNRRAGIEIVGAGVTALGVNVLDRNGGLGIDLGADGVTANDPGDADGGPNGGQNFPALTGATSSAAGTRVTGTIDAVPSTTFRVDLYSGPACDPSGHGEAARVLGSVLVTTDAGGQASFDATIPGATPAGRVVTATATRLAHELRVATSELSACVPVTAG